MTETIIIRDGEDDVIAVYAPDVMHAVLRDGWLYCWIGEPRPNRHDEEAWIEVVWD